MIAYSRELAWDGYPMLCAVCVGDFESPTALFIDVLIYRETLTAGTYTLAYEHRDWSFELPEAATNQGFPGATYNVQVDLKE